MNNSAPSSSTCSVAQSHRSDYSKRSIRVDNVVMHYCDEIGIPSDARKIDVHRKFVDALNTDHRSVEIIRLISELYWIETDCRIHLYRTPNVSLNDGNVLFLYYPNYGKFSSRYLMRPKI